MYEYQEDPGSEVARRNVKRWGKMLKTLHSMGEIRLNELEMLKNSAAIMRSNDQFKNLTRWASNLGV